MTTDQSDWFAAIDLGSNSFHLLVVRHHEGRLQVRDRHREMVRLAAGLDSDGNLSEESQERALACLSRFGERIRNLPRYNVRIVGTNALRRARNASDFALRASALLGREIEIISGREEARLIFSGVSYALEDDEERRLVVDIGGGSTELILGYRARPRLTESLHMGCVTMSQAYFDDGGISKARMREARLAAMQELAPIKAVFRGLAWESVVGASGTMLAIADILAAEGWSQEGISADGLARLVRALIEAGHVDRLMLEGLSPERRAVFPGGVAILQALMRSFELERIQVSSGALREGVVIDLLGRFEHNDIRNDSARDLATRFHVDEAHAARVKHTALRLFDGVASEFAGNTSMFRNILGWAAQVHEIGLDIAHTQYHKHGGYLLSHMDLPGFSQGEQRRMSLLVRAHRRKFPVQEFSLLDATERQVMLKLACILRLAVLLHRGRTEAASAPVSLDIAGKRIALKFLSDWLEHHPLTRLDLEQECAFLADAGIGLEIRDGSVEEAAK
ncbi:MAG: exopolyphosphatase [Gammaproteobacteria bacterium]|nr:exopolyphosphatase [Gammaproteobacteria bacterium]MCY4279020.1 exopolyphosphatase [Gammaproteobacteria bacterium]